MSCNLRHRSFLKELDFTPGELYFLLKLSADLKAAKYAGYEQPRLAGKDVAMIFEKTSTRTRTSFEVAAKDQGAHVTYLEPSGSQIGHKESIKDTARVLGRTYDAIEYRGFSQRAEESGRYSKSRDALGLVDASHVHVPPRERRDLLERARLTRPVHEIRRRDSVEVGIIGISR